MTCKFTLGPWCVSPAGKSVVAYETLDTPRGDRVVTQAIASRIQRKANARLIAAAPALAGYVQTKAEQGDPEAIKLWEMVCGR